MSDAMSDSCFCQDWPQRDPTCPRHGVRRHPTIVVQPQPLAEKLRLSPVVTRIEHPDIPQAYEVTKHEGMADGKPDIWYEARGVDLNLLGRWATEAEAVNACVKVASYQRPTRFERI